MKGYPSQKPDYSDSIDTIDKNSYSTLIHHFAIACSLVFTVFGFIYLLTTDKQLLGAFELVLGIAQIINLWIFRTRDTLIGSSRFLAASVYAMSLMIFITGGLGHTGYIWIIFIPFFTMLFLPQPEALRWLVFYSTSLLIILFIDGTSSFIHLPYETIEIRQSLIAFLIVTYLTYHNEKHKDRRHHFIVLQNQDLDLASKTDPLTGLYNRRFMNEKLKEVAQDSPEALSLIMVDIDHFKEINDTYGHDAGDRVLLEFSSLLKEHFSSNCYASRWGGEEFLLLCADSSLDTAKAIAETIRKKVKELQFEYPLNLTASFGVMTVDKTDIPKTLVEVDRLLYQAKQQGRDRIYSQAAN